MVSKKKKIGIILVLCLIIVAIGLSLLFQKTELAETVKRESAKLFQYEFIPNQKLDIMLREVTLRKDSIYQDFRGDFRFHYQTIALATFSDSSRLILIAEPPPHFEIDSIHSIFSKFTRGVEMREHKIGYDGKIIDILISVANATDENINRLIKRLSKELYLSDYKPQVMTLPVQNSRRYYSESNLDYQITLFEFYDWFIENEESFIQLRDTGQKETISTIFAERKRGVYFSEQPGFVAWAIAKKSDLSEQLEYIRQFTLDADLILGALADSNTLVVIGREREAPLYELPPLNIESILLLASITEKELSQSLDVNDFLAGKMGNGRDWCPTYLSKELENTEFGHLMTITDILLKNWSENGTIQEGYYRYPRPSRYPFDKPLFKKLGINELVYNWNTANAMYAIDLEEATIYTLNRTGSLPVSYFNSSERNVSVGRRYENQAYNYFATVSNTDLARVVQYTALYQLFIDNEISYSGNVYTSYPKNKANLLLNPVQNMLTFFKSLSDKDIDYLSDTISKIQFSEFHYKHVDKQMSANEERYNFSYNDVDREKIYGEVKGNTKQYIAKEFHKVKKMLNAVSEKDFVRISRYLANPRGNRIQNQEDYNIYLKARQCNELMRAIGKNHLTVLGVDLNEVKNFYVNNLAHTSAKYLKTPSVIITFNDFYTTGGHNLSSKISRVNTMTNYKRSSGGGYETKSDPEPVAKPSTTTPTQPKTTAKPVKPTTTTATTTNTSSGKSTTKSSNAPASTKPVTRPRSEVISAAPRGQRGL